MGKDWFALEPENHVHGDDACGNSNFSSLVQPSQHLVKHSKSSDKPTENRGAFLRRQRKFPFGKTEEYRRASLNLQDVPLSASEKEKNSLFRMKARRGDKKRKQMGRSNGMSIG